MYGEIFFSLVVFATMYAEITNISDVSLNRCKGISLCLEIAVHRCEDISLCLEVSMHRCKEISLCLEMAMYRCGKKTYYL